MIHTDDTSKFDDNDGENLYRFDEADKWSLGPSFVVGIPVMLIGMGVGIDVGAGNECCTGTVWLSQVTGVSAAVLQWISVGLTVISFAGLFFVIRQWLQRKDEMERNIEYRTMFWTFLVVMASAVLIAMMQSLLPIIQEKGAWGVVIALTSIYIVSYFLIRAQLRRGFHTH